MTDNPCTRGTFRTVFSSNLPAEQACPGPVLQVLQVKTLPQQTGTTGDRFRVVFSDTDNFIQSMLASQSATHVHNGSLTKGSFVRLTSYQANAVKNKRILIVLALEVLTDLGVRERIGNPSSMEDAPMTAPAAAPSGPQPKEASAGSFYSNKPQAQSSRAIPAAASRSTGNAGAPGQPVYPIEAISPYQNKWMIKARVTYKSDKKEWHNTKSEGRLFTVNFLDESGEIRATGFNEELDNFYDVLQEGHIYYVSKCRVNMAKRQFSNVNNDYELTFNRDTEIREAEQDDGVPQMRFNFVPIADLGRVEPNSVVDVLGIVKEIGEEGEIEGKENGKKYNKREISIVDASNTQVRLTLWGPHAKDCPVNLEQCVGFKGVKVSEFGGRSLSMAFSSTFTADPDVDEAHALMGWYEAQQGSNRDLSTFESHKGLAGTMGAAGGREEVYKTLAQVRDESLGMDEKGDYFTTKATIVYVKHENVSYPACASETCNKKVEEIDGTWKCEKCGHESDKPQYRYIMTISVNDAFGQAWFSCFDEVGRLIMGKSADELHELKETDEKLFEDAFQEAICKTFIFRCRAKMDSYQDEQRVRYQVMRANPMNFALESAKLVEQIKLYGTD